MLTEEQKRELHAALMTRYRELEAQLAHNDHFGQERALVKDSVGELSNYDNHPSDLGTEEYERAKDIALNEHAEQELSDVKRALAAFAEGTYGICEICGEEIPLERLQAVPTTTRCRNHAADRFVSRKRPAEEDILEPPFGRFEYDDQDVVVFDAEDAWQSAAAHGSSDTPSDFYDPAKEYEEMFAEADERVGAVEDVEEFLITDMEGNYIGVNEEHEVYETYLDEHGVTSVVEDSGLIDVVNEDEPEQDQDPDYRRKKS
ncbi:transcriptional regulator, TraR/DksA family [Caldalkalibacillus thermarum TA2.A1]|uniref:TraR/DksA C4-type zinc finger protein n=1 Tax=Caldalkalibacillus thermarum (strain TA2.A1) TaxID=986075 RepID=F5L7Y8_CALTT|nr:TraR/DksA C4-type zinc finger protein [Caldalkalibacillus thermarum]EGL82576.1 transcriptional regulator, TraR/DksA family [Caldalkalibacillus thermarum TA2.A1]QZT34775.1 TraR/DksA C4-type zinc finger protein [Caldalkalibacillus thermarum TA2.A1]